MDVNSTNNRTLSILPADYVLWYLNEKLFEKNKPAIVFLLISMVVGTVGNGLVIYVYGWCLRPNSSKNIFITWLAVFDLISCCVTIPFEAFDLRFPMLYGEGTLCKISRTLAFAVNITSGLILVLIAFDRLQITKPPYKSYTRKKTRMLILLVTVISFVVSAPALFVFGTKTIPTIFPDVNGKDCSYDDFVKDTQFPVIYYVFLAVIFLSTFIILGILYIKIAIAIYEWKHTIIGDALAMSIQNGHKLPRSISVDSAKIHSANSKNTSISSVSLGESFDSENKQIRNHTKNNHNSSDFIECETQTDSQDRNPNSSIQQSDINLANSTRSTKSSITDCKDNEKRKQSLKEKASPIKSNVLFITITVVFVLSYLPFLLFELLKRVLEEGTFNETAFEVVTKSVYLNNLVNPVIYGIYNEKYREEIYNLFCTRQKFRSSSYNTSFSS
ncbi:alpha-2Da adrenergic receptor-like [Saccostrea echinata]|uniref:alpha-2Da adrenergic receptor-like n=1 Tax=Saccostrea echinata TaxID=191078 RepID=UPI002A811912|nr:alpha-2Da adrenergic receptor-like [Saccostrea echinata]